MYILNGIYISCHMCHQKFFSKDGFQTTLSLPNPPLMWISNLQLRLKVIVRSCCSCYVKPVQLDPGIVAASRVDVKIRFIVGHLGFGENKRTPKMVGGGGGWNMGNLI